MNKEKLEKEYKIFLNEYKNLCGEIFLFQVKWGIEIGFTLKNVEVIKGRDLISSKEIDEYFREPLQEKINNMKGKKKK
jgi:hypothetical protein